VSEVKQNPHRCTDVGCILLRPGAFVGMSTNGGCTCRKEMASKGGIDHVTRRRIIQGVLWLRDQLKDER